MTMERDIKELSERCQQCGHMGVYHKVDNGPCWETCGCVAFMYFATPAQPPMPVDKEGKSVQVAEIKDNAAPDTQDVCGRCSHGRQYHQRMNEARNDKACMISCEEKCQSFVDSKTIDEMNDDNTVKAESPISAPVGTRCLTPVDGGGEYDDAVAAYVCSHGVSYHANKVPFACTICECGSWAPLFADVADAINEQRDRRRVEAPRTFEDHLMGLDGEDLRDFDDVKGSFLEVAKSFVEAVEAEVESAYKHGVVSYDEASVKVMENEVAEATERAIEAKNEAEKREYETNIAVQEFRRLNDLYRAQNARLQEIIDLLEEVPKPVTPTFARAEPADLVRIEHLEKELDVAKHATIKSGRQRRTSDLRGAAVAQTIHKAHQTQSGSDDWINCKMSRCKKSRQIMDGLGG